MNENIKAGSDIHAGDGGYSIGTKEKYDEFVKIRNKSLAEARIQRLKQQAGIDDNPDQEGLNLFAELIVKECLEACSRANEIRHFVPPTQEQVVLSCMREIETTFRSLRMNESIKS